MPVRLTSLKNRDGKGALRGFLKVLRLRYKTLLLEFDERDAQSTSYFAERHSTT